MKILLIGSGGREHAIAWRLAGSDLCTKLYCARGNPGIESVAECVPIAADDVAGICAFAAEREIDFVVVGPEGPLVAGLADELQKLGIAVFGPTRDAAQLEGSKGFTKDLCRKYDIPTAAYGRFSSVEGAKAFIRATGAPIVIKADGLAAGKGVIIAQTVKEAEAAVDDMLSGGLFGEAAREIVVEEFLDGEELSFFALSDGETTVPFDSAQDHKRAFDGDLGPNTGGMGAYAPAGIMTTELHDKIMDRIIYPTVAGLKADGIVFRGVLFAGIMVVRSEPFLIEYNVRFGDPECEVILLRLESDLLTLLKACADGQLARYEGKIGWSSNAALCVVLAAEGYPGAYRKGEVIGGVDAAGQEPGIKVFHAGTAKNAAGEIVSHGGRVLTVAASAGSVAEAQRLAYEAVDKIDWPGGFCRRDIGWRAVGKS